MTRLSTETHFFTDAVICQGETLIVEVWDVLTTSCNNNNKLLSTKKMAEGSVVMLRGDQAHCVRMFCVFAAPPSP